MELTAQEKSLLIEAYFKNGGAKKPVFFVHETGAPITVNKLLASSWLRNKKRWRKNKRLWKKFRKNFERYVPDNISSMFWVQHLSAFYKPGPFPSQIVDKIIQVESLPEGAFATYYKDKESEA
jgi:hypothetical protein